MADTAGITYIEQIPLEEKKVFIRLDLNVPLKEGKITDETRIQAALPTIRHALERRAKIILCSHLGRPQGNADRRKLSLEPVAARLSELLDADVHLVEEPAGDATKALLNGLKQNQLLLLENIRFDEGEEKNSEELASVFSALVDVYINDAFGASHRAHATIDALPRMMKVKGAGFLIKKELEMLDQVLTAPKAPFCALLGGAKVSDKIGVIENLLEKIDTFIIGGAMAYTFLAAQKIATGSSKIEKDKVSLARELLARLEARNKKVFLPIDHIIAQKFDAQAETQITSSAAIPEGWMGLDIGPKTAELYAKELSRAGTIFWNGPMGVFEMEAFSKGSFRVAQAIAESSAFSIVGGGDSASAVNASGYADKMSHISTGGGASLEYLQGDKLPGLEALKPPKRSSL
ncbi:MAG: phosphoglycerate kinase [Bdellovibrionales bacterium]